MNQADFYEIIEIKNKTNSITLENEEIENAKSNEAKGIFCRALVNGNWGFASTTKEEKEKSIKKAIRAAKHNPIKKETELADVKKLNKKKNLKIKENPINVSQETKVEFLKEARKKAVTDNIVSTKLTYSDSRIELTYKNSENSSGEYVLYRTGASAKAIAKKNQELQSARERVYATKGYEVFKENNFLEKCEEIGKKATSLLEADSPPSGKYPVILDPDLAGVFIHEALGHASEGDLVVMDESILKDKLGQKIGSEKVTVKDDPSIKGLFGYYPFDWEGVESAETTIIKDGVLKNYLNSRESSKKTNTPVTANFRSQSFSTNPLVRMSNTYLESGEHSFDELIEDIQKGVYLRGSRGGQVSSAEGNFQFNAGEGYIIKDGELKNKVKDVSLSGNTLETLKNIKKLSSKKEFYPGRCGKGGQLVPVTDGAPHTKISEILVGGQESV